MRLFFFSIIFVFFLCSPCFSLVHHSSLKSVSSDPSSVFSHIKLWKGDVTELDTQSIVCSTTPLLKPDGPLGEQVLLKAGPRLKRAIEWDRERISAGDNIIALGFDLPAEYILFAVPPLHNNYDGLYKSYFAILKEANNHQIKSIALTAIGTGSKRQLPADLSATVAVQVSIDFLKQHSKHYLKDIVLVVYTDTLFNAYFKAIQLALNNEQKQIEYLKQNSLNSITTPLYSKNVPEKCVFCSLPSSKILYQDEHVQLFKDIETESSKIHLLLIPHSLKLNSVLDFLDVSSEKCYLLHHMINVGHIVMQDILGLKSNKYKLDFHKPPYTTVNHLHLHLQSLPYNRPSYYQKFVSHVPAQHVLNKMNCDISKFQSWKKQLELRRKIKEKLMGKLMHSFMNNECNINT